MTDIEEIKKALKEYDGRTLTFMEVCGTHTASISENGIVSLLSPKIKLISGPGCPVCVTVASYIDRLIEISMMPGYEVVTFGDLIRVNGSEKSLRAAGAEGGRFRMIYSPLEILDIARANPDTIYVFAAVGFETTTPVYALLMEEMLAGKIKNIRLLTALKTMPAVIDAVCSENTTIDGFIAPGHVAAITGSKMFEPLSEKYGLPFVVSGFEGAELLASIYALVKLAGKPRVLNLYGSVVEDRYNEKAYEKVSKFFEPSDAAWRGLGIINNSGMILKKEYSEYDMGSAILTEDTMFNKGCSCADVICGRKSPRECPLFGKVCTPGTPQGACMVSMEGSCFNYYINDRM